MDALKLRMRAKDQLHPLLQDLVTGYARFKGSKDWEGRSKMVGWCAVYSFFFHSLGLITVSRLITLNGMKASEEISEEQSRQVAPPACTITRPFVNLLITASLRR
jgi:ESCRT-I complex subunit VPS28